jgi:hypothetical protein
MGTSARDLFPDQPLLFFGRSIRRPPGHDSASTKDDFSHFNQPGSTTPPRPCDDLGPFADEGYQLDQYFGADKGLVLSPFSLDPVSPQHKLGQTTVLTTAPVSLLVEREAGYQDYPPVDPDHSSDLVVQEERTFEEFFSFTETDSPPQDDFTQSIGSAAPLVKSSAEKSSQVEQSSKMTIDNIENSSAETRNTEPTATQLLAEHNPPGECVTVAQDQASGGTPLLQSSSGKENAPVSPEAAMESPKPVRSGRRRGRPPNPPGAVVIPDSSAPTKKGATNAAGKTRTQSGIGRARSNKRHQDSTTEQAVKRAKTVEDGINQDQEIQQPGELPKECEDGAIRKEEIQPQQDLQMGFSAPEDNQSPVHTALQHILSFRSDLDHGPRQYSDQENLHCDSGNPLQGDADDANSVAMHNALGMTLPESVDDILVRAFFHATASNIDALYVAHGKKRNLICLWDAIPPECVREYRNQNTFLKIQDTEAAMKQVLTSANTLEDFATSQERLEELLNQRRIGFDLYRAQISTISRAHATVEHLLKLSDALRTSDRNLTAKLEEADAALERARHEIKPLEFLAVADEFKIFLERGLASSEHLNGQREKRTRLLEAVEAAALKAFADDLKTEVAQLEQQK